MSKLSLVCGLALSLTATVGMAQDVVIDNFESYTDNGGIQNVWKPALNANEATQLGSGGAVAGSNQHVIFQDGGFSFNATALNIVTPAAGNYRLSFWYQNGLDATPFLNAKLEVVQDGAIRTSVDIPNGPQAAWTQLQSTPAAFTGSPITVSLKTTSNGPAMIYKMALDDVLLIQEAAVPLNVTVWPDDRIYLSRTETLTATPSFGSGTYTKVEFDVNNDNTVEHTDTSAPFEFTWDTLVHVPQDTSRTLNLEEANTPIPVKITVTDSNNNTFSIIEEYTVDNRFNGRESMVTNGSFSLWQPERPGSVDGNPPMTLPVGWEEQWTTSTAPEIGPAPGRNPAAGDALRIKFSNSTVDGVPDAADRYAVRSEGKTGRYRDLQTMYWGKGTYCRLYYLTSPDGGVSFRTTLQDAGVVDNNAAWTFALETTPQNGLGLTDTTQVALGTHQLTTAEHFWDDVVSEGIKLPATSEVGEWKLY